MSLDVKMHQALSGGAAIAALVSTRIYPLVLPQSVAYPAISYQRISNTGQMGTTALRESRWQVNCWALTYTAAQALAVAVKNALEEYTATATAPRIKMVLVVNELDDFDPEANIFRVIVDVMLTTSGD